MQTRYDHRTPSPSLDLHLQIAQNVVVELNFRSAILSSPDDKTNGTATSRSVYVGWTGMQSQTKLASIVGTARERGGSRHDQNVATVEMDSTLARMLGLSEGAKVRSETLCPSIQLTRSSRSRSNYTSILHRCTPSISSLSLRLTGTVCYSIAVHLSAC